jgi:hypothetical protein
MLDPNSLADREEARRLTDVFRRPFLPPPFVVGTDLEVTPNYIKVPFIYGPSDTLAHAWVHRVTEQVASSQPNPL